MGRFGEGREEPNLEMSRLGRVVSGHWWAWLLSELGLQQVDRTGWGNKLRFPARGCGLPGSWGAPPSSLPVPSSGQAGNAAEGHCGAAGPGPVHQPIRPLTHRQDGVCWLPGREGGFLPGEPSTWERGQGPQGTPHQPLRSWEQPLILPPEAPLSQKWGGGLLSLVHHQDPLLGWSHGCGFPF